MAYIKTTWTDNESPYLNAYNLNKIEEGIHSTSANTDTNTENIADNTENIADNRTDIDINAGNILGLSVGEVYQGTWTPQAGTEYPSSPEGGWSYYIQFLDDDGYTFTGGDLVGRVANNSDKIIYNGTSWSMLDNTSEQLGYYLVDDIESMLALSPLEGALCEVYGYYEANDGGGGSFNYRGALSGTNNGGTIIDGWVRRETEAVNVRGFGAKGDGITDDSEAFNNAFEVSRSVFAIDGVFIVDNLSMDGNTLSGGGTLTHKAGATTSMITMTGECHISDIKFDGNAVNQTQTYNLINIQSGEFSSISSCFFTKTRYKTIQIDVALSERISIENNTFSECGAIDGCNVVELRSSYCQVLGNTFISTGNGHNVRTGLLDSDATTTPVSDTVISGNIFKDSVHVGVTCEIYSEGVSITGNTFTGLDQAIKCEPSGDTVKGVVITGNVISDIALATALSLQVEGVIFDSNTCTNILGILDLGNNSVCSNNYFNNCGDVASETIRQTSYYSGSNISGNTIIDAPYRGISVANSGTITNNRIFNTTDRGISCSGSALVITGNHIDGCVYGVVVTSTSSNFIIDDNIFLNASTLGLSYVINELSASSFIGDNIGYNFGVVSLDIVNGSLSIGVTHGAITVGTEGGAPTDLLHTIVASDTSNVIVLRVATVDRLVTVQDGVGNIRLQGGADFSFTSNIDTLSLIYTGSLWVEISRSLNYT